ncbi:hypothetical protein Ae406Ps2_1269c [Pseudonocardia sp. Ae406_Ps2]|nr:hypothetical protein Ae406Ps2_1269c [Pseudonocardia sp. Ae406_Ps2]OLM06934.1 hypothetical protein Ae331Ps2_4644 [Pseudonocardia sp. Ae331_Ps2]OLM14110.1 hypothetical protein Ae505Ps2_4240 [Pseudonocardia sp. Ae505_Ps2]OLM22843.1 hypothetical protein Ae706Ps2_1275c [Pseudonocardia sp. Ae706_Ps2]
MIARRARVVGRVVEAVRDDLRGAAPRDPVDGTHMS